MWLKSTNSSIENYLSPNVTNQKSFPQAIWHKLSPNIPAIPHFSPAAF